jgi:hypothetical protein
MKPKISKYESYATEVIDFLINAPWSNLKQIQSVIDHYHITTGRATRIPRADAIVYYIRSNDGENVLVCDRHTNLYRIADSKAVGQVWLNTRKKNIRNQIARTLRAVEVLIRIFGSDADLDMIKASLSANLTILDASLSGGSSGSVGAAV